jgi:hypothetical protein
VTTLKKAETHESLLHQAARECLKKSDGTSQAAAALLIKRIRRDRVLRDEITDSHLPALCTQYIRQMMGTNRRAAFPTGIVAVSKFGALLHSVGQEWLDFPLPGGLRLAEASRAELIEASERYMGQSKTMLRRARWLRLCARSVPEDKKAGDVLTNERLAEIDAEVCKTLGEKDNGA